MRSVYLWMALPLLLTGCVEARDATVSIAYTPSSLAETPFDLHVGEFVRATPANVGPAQYETTGYTFNKQISLSEPLADYLKNAFVQEIRHGGASLRDTPACTVSARINQMALKSNGGTKLTWSSDLIYTVDAAGSAPLAVPVTATVVTNTASAEAGHTQFVTKTIDGLLLDPAFTRFAKSHCPRSGA